MNNLPLALLLMLFSTLAQATGTLQVEINNQQDAQALCVQERISTCIAKLCQSKEDQNCVQTCTETVKHECRQAGE